MWKLNITETIELLFYSCAAAFVIVASGLALNTYLVNKFGEDDDKN